MIETKKKIGSHPCGGEVWYIATSSMGWRACLKCAATTMKGHNLDTVEEIARREADFHDIEQEERISPTIED